MKSPIKSLLQFVLFLSMGILILYLLFKGQSEAYALECIEKNIASEDCSLVSKLIEDFRHVKIMWILLTCMLFMVSNIFRALRWHQLLDTMGYKPRLFNSIGAIVIAYFANLGIPRIGEIVRAGTISKYEKIPVERAMGTIIVGRLLDFICLFVVIGLAFMLTFNTFIQYFRDNFIYNPKMIILIVFVAIAFLAAGFIVFNKIINSVNSPNRLIVKLQGMWIGFKDGLKSVAKVKNKPLLVLYSIGIWLMYYLMIYLCFFAYEPTAHLGPIAGLVAFVFGSLGIVFPAPGGMGSYQFMVSQALVIYGVGSVEAFTFSNIVFFAIQIFGNILFGILFLIILPFYNKA